MSDRNKEDSFVTETVARTGGTGQLAALATVHAEYVHLGKSVGEADASASSATTTSDARTGEDPDGNDLDE